jgi:hypothetical protein
MNVFLGGFWVLAVVCALLYLVTKAALPASNVAGFSEFQRSYLVVYLLAMGKQSFLKDLFFTKLTLEMIMANSFILILSINVKF